MAKMTNTFSQGMDQDSSKNKYDNTHYFEAENLRLFSQEGTSAGALEDIEGTLQRINLDPISALPIIVIGYNVLRDDLILFLTENISSAPDATTYNDFIISIPTADIENLAGTDVYTTTALYVHNGGNLLYTEKLGFSTVNPIQCVSRYENEYVKKLYWVDGHNRLRYLNTVYDSETNNLPILPIDHLEVIANLDLTQPEIVGITGGNLRSGKIQYAYQLYILNGSKTSVSPLSQMIHLTEPSDTSTHSLYYSGSKLDVNTGKGVECVIPIESTQFTRLRLYAVHYTTFEDEPEVRIVSEIAILPTDNSVTITDVGEIVGTITLEEFRILSTALFVPEVIETKDNILFIGNLEEDQFDVDYDARAYRFGGIGTLVTDYNYNPTPTKEISILYNTDDTYYVVYPAGRFMDYTTLSVTDYYLANVFFTGQRYRIRSQATVDFTLYGAPTNIVGQVFTSLGTSTIGVGDSLDNLDSFIAYDDLITKTVVTEIPEEADCITRGNNMDYDVASTYDRIWNQRYQEDGSTLGGEGVNVSYTFEITETQISRNHSTSVYAYQDRDGSADNFSYRGHASPVLGGGNLVSHQRDEVYRYGIVFFNEKGQSSFAKWIGDIRMPSVSAYDSTSSETFDLTAISSDTTDVLGRVLGIIFTISNIPTDQGITHYQIVRVKRLEIDRSIVAQGLVSNTLGNGADLFWRADWDYGAVNYGTSFISPEIGFYNTLEFKPSTDTWNMVALQQCDISTYGYLNSLFHIRNWRYSTFTPEAPEDEYTDNKFSNPDGSVIHEGEDNVAFDATGNQYNSNVDEHSSTASFIWEAFGLNTTAWVARFKSASARWICNYRRNNHLSRYGGITYSSRSRNEYIVASDIVPIATATVDSYRGDTYINFYEHLYKTLRNGEAITSATEFVLFPCESTINNPLRNPTNYPFVSSNYAYLLHEKAGVWTDNASTELLQLEKYWSYNKVYSRDGDGKIFIDKPFDWRPQEEFDTRVYASFTKTNGEFEDNWLLYPANQFIEVDAQHGPLTALKTVNSKLLFFQTQAFGVLSVNERALLETPDVSQLSLGVSGILNRYDYSKTDIGCSHWRQVILTPNGLYWVDALDKAMYAYTAGPEEISLMKGMDTWFRNNVDNADGSINDGMHMWYDAEYKEVCLTDTVNNWTLVYNEIIKSFIGFTDIQPNIVMNYLDKTVGLDTLIPQVIYKHNDPLGQRGHFYGSWYSLSLTLLINPHPDNVAIFNNFEWFTESFNYDVTFGLEDRPVTYTGLEMWNDYQNTGAIGLIVDDNVKRRMRKWRYTIPRGIYSRDGIRHQDERYARMRDTHMFAKFTYTPDESANKSFVMHDIITSHNLSNK